MGEAFVQGGLIDGETRQDAWSDAAQWGLDPTLLGLAERPGIWPENLAATQAFAAVASQLRFDDGACRGLDYAGAASGFALAGITVTPAIWSDVQVIEAAAVEAINRRRS